ncbi:hypothetical protein HI806_12935 [Ralstonia solanacearum]|nr:hypothetical protein BCR16_12540 [Ralstonia solanacearum FJAT-1458]QKL72100.1 hypothetical protein HI806_12935 [Ralstonia solanacearum]QKL77305.1 hypothetical protein HI805_12945 [Ralstonia solanacearum]QKL82511.1 hypothetical protein HI804_12945 [Ralstonia solanacearum]QKL87721.1 hypothetical protein HI803_12950 [Ralstonia solanacearum]
MKRLALVLACVVVSGCAVHAPHEEACEKFGDAAVEATRARNSGVRFKVYDATIDKKYDTAAPNGKWSFATALHYVADRIYNDPAFRTSMEIDMRRTAESWCRDWRQSGKVEF